jgi:hypothetical protein
MTLDDLEELARQKGLTGRANQELQHVLDDVSAEEDSYVLWHRMFIISAGIALWVMMFGAVVFLLGLDYDLALPSGLGTFLAAVLAVTFWIFLVAMFKSQAHLRELSSAEARAYAILISK